MNRSRAELEAELLARFELELDSLLDWAESNRAPTLVEIEEAVLRCRREMGKAMADSVVKAQESVQLAPGPRCPTCGEEMHVKGRKRKNRIPTETCTGAPASRCCAARGDARGACAHQGGQQR